MPASAFSAPRLWSSIYTHPTTKPVRRHARKRAQAVGTFERQQDDHERREFIARRMACGVSEQQAQREYDKLDAESGPYDRPRTHSGDRR